jgi:hypothetical protein
MRRVMRVLAAMVVMVPLFAAVAYAATIDGTSQGDILLDSNLDDTMYGRGSADEIRADAFGPAGFITCENPCSAPDKDVAKGGGGGDFISTFDGDELDTAIGGAGNDTCVGDTLAELDCENESVGMPVGAPPGV